MLENNFKTARNILAVLLITAIFFIAGCCNGSGDSPCNYRPPPPPNPVALLKLRGVLIIRTGETYNLVLPSDRLFYQDSANFSPQGRGILVPLIQYLRNFETTTIKVAGYTDNGSAPLRSKALSEKQAQRVAAYLTRKKIDARIIYGIGYGENFPVADNSTAKGRAQNRRVEVRFRKVIIPGAIE